MSESVAGPGERQVACLASSPSHSQDGVRCMAPAQSVTDQRDAAANTLFQNISPVLADV